MRQKTASLDSEYARLADLRSHLDKILVAVFFATIFGYTAYKVPQLGRIEDTVRALSLDFMEALGAQDVARIEDLARLPFYLGSDRLESMDDVRARFSTLFEHARQSTEDRSDSDQIRGGAVLSRFVAEQTARADYDMAGALDFRIHSDLEAEDEEDRESLLLPSQDLLIDGARVSTTIRGLSSADVNRVHLYFTVVSDDAADLRAVVFEKP